MHILRDTDNGVKIQQKNFVVDVILLSYWFIIILVNYFVKLHYQVTICQVISLSSYKNLVGGTKF